MNEFLKRCVGPVNFFLVQWLFCRICYHYDPNDPAETAIKWGILYPVIPMTGWWSEYRPRKRYML